MRSAAALKSIFIPISMLRTPSRSGPQSNRTVCTLFDQKRLSEGASDKAAGYIHHLFGEVIDTRGLGSIGANLDLLSFGMYCGVDNEVVPDKYRRCRLLFRICDRRHGV